MALDAKSVVATLNKILEFELAGAGTVEQHLGEVDKLSRKPGDIGQFKAS